MVRRWSSDSRYTSTVTETYVPRLEGCSLIESQEISVPISRLKSCRTYSRKPCSCRPITLKAYTVGYWISACAPIRALLSPPPSEQVRRELRQRAALALGHRDVPGDLLVPEPVDHVHQPV